MTAYMATLRETFEEQVLTEAYARTADPAKLLRDFIRRSLGRHRVEFTQGIGVHDSDVIAYAAQTAAESRPSANP
jgi:hypothetical protein